MGDGAKRALMPSFQPPQYTLITSAQMDNDRINAKRTSHTSRASVTITRLDITKRLRTGDPTQLYVLQMVSEETLHVLKDTIVEMTLW